MRERVHAEPREYAHSIDGKTKRARGYALVSASGKPMFVGLFVDETKAADYCKARGWTFAKAAA